MATIVNSSLSTPAILNYYDLQTIIAKRLKRTDLGSDIPVYIRMVESRINTTLYRARELESSYQTITTAGNNSISLPDDFGSLKNAQIIGSTNYVLDILSDDNLLQMSSNNYQDIPQYFVIQGNSMLLYPIPNGEYTVSIIYYTTLKGLSSINTTNWLLSKAPDVYLYGALVEACIDTQDFDLLQIYEPRYQQAMNNLDASFTVESFSGPALKATSAYIV